MSYDHQKDQAPLIAFAAASVSLASAAEVAVVYPGLRKMRVRRIGITVTVSPTTTPPVVSFRHRITPRSATGQTVIDTITIPVGAAIGSIYYVDGLDYVIPPGDELQAEVTTAAAAGSGILHVESEPIWEVEANNSNMVLSA